MEKLLIGFIGAGKMATALMRGLKNGYSFIASDRDMARLNLIRDLGGRVASGREVAMNADIVVLAVKPKDVSTALSEISGSLQGKIVISIAAGIRIPTIQALIPESKIVRVMPNAPALVGEMAAAYSFGNGLTEKEKKSVRSLLESIGLAIELKEDDLDAVTALSGSGPAFFAKIAESFISAATTQGLDRSVAARLCVKTMLGTARLIEANHTPNEVIGMVTSPGGTTEAGLVVMEKSDMEKVIGQVVAAATKRSKELSTKNP